jgi:hypothetical protein
VAFGVKLPALRSAPNTLKPSDLSGKGIERPIGISGVLSAADVVRRIGAVCGLRLHAAPVYRTVPVFLGSPAITCGEALDGLCLALQGAWRRVGDDYVLAWDVRGIGALQQVVGENANADPIWEAKERRDRMARAPAWLTLAADVPSDPDDPLALTPKQREGLLGPDRPGDAIPFSDMTPAQQAYLLGRVETEKARTLPRDVGAFDPHTMFVPVTITADEVQTAVLAGGAHLAVSLKLPERGWVPVQDAGFGGIDSDRLDDAYNAAHKSGPPVEESFGPVVDAAPGSLEMRAPLRGLMVPVLTPGVLTEVTENMRRHGLNVLFYPALEHGYATFPNAAFPLDPALKGRNGWAMAAASAKAAGLPMIGTISVLDWSPVARADAWAAKHRDWLDVDITGRTRAEWTAQFPGRPIGALLRLTDGHDFVRPLEPAVVSRLETLMDALARQASASGVALVDWKPAGADRRFLYEPDVPALGYAMPERIASVRETGSDPVDNAPYMTAGSQTFEPSIFTTLGIAPRDLRAAQGFGQPGRSPKPADPWTGLAASLLARAKTARPDWSSWISEPLMPYPAIPVSQSTPLPPVDHTLTVASYFWGDKPGYLLTIWPRSSESPETLARWGYHAITNALRMENSTKAPQFKEVVLDFRAAPEEISGALRLIKGPEPAGATVIGSGDPP